MSWFTEFPKIPRLFRSCVITEKIDGTNASIRIVERFDGMSTSGCIADIGSHVMWAGSRTRWITPDSDNHGFARWATDHAAELFGLGPGHHYGEWWGQGIQRGYGLKMKRFSLFNVGRWDYDPGVDLIDPATGTKKERPPSCCDIVPIVWYGQFSTEMVKHTIETLRREGSRAAPGFMRPEGVVVWHDAARMLFKATIEKDEQPKGKR